MKGNDKVIEVLNALLADELTAINQYVVHSEMCDNWGYERLHKRIERRAIDEMKHAEGLIGRILFLEGLPVVSRLNPIHVGSDVKRQFEHDIEAEAGAIRAYNDAIVLCGTAGDFGTRELLEKVLKDEEDHLDWLEAQMDQIRQIGFENYLTQQLKGD